MTPRTLTGTSLEPERARFRRWERRIERLVRAAEGRHRPRRVTESLESLWHRKERVGIKIERLARSCSRGAPAGSRGALAVRRDLARAWVELEQAWDVALGLLTPSDRSARFPSAEERRKQ